MCDEWMPNLRYSLTREEYETLPRNPAYRYEYGDGGVLLNPQPRHFHALLDLSSFHAEVAVSAGLHIRPMRAGDRPLLPGAFAAAFDHIQPFGSLTEPTRLVAARSCLTRTWTGGDGVWVEEASFVAAPEEDERPVGGIFITLVPGGDPGDASSYSWTGPPPPDCLARRAAQPHLTWIFVPPLHAKRGLGSALLATSAQVVSRLGYGELWTTFMDGNVSSMLWHWRNGFRLVRHAGSRRPV